MRWVSRSNILKDTKEWQELDSVIELIVTDPKSLGDVLFKFPQSRAEQIGYYLASAASMSNFGFLSHHLDKLTLTLRNGSLWFEFSISKTRRVGLESGFCQKKNHDVLCRKMMIGYNPERVDLSSCQRNCSWSLIRYLEMSPTILKGHEKWFLGCKI